MSRLRSVTGVVFLPMLSFLVQPLTEKVPCDTKDRDDRQQNEDLKEQVQAIMKESREAAELARNQVSRATRQNPLPDPSIPDSFGPNQFGSDQ